ncbi:hypothetical protein [Paenibacillus campi]|nr:hypothetical protein [Paenibacillus sp. SGZ-1009]
MAYGLSDVTDRLRTVDNITNEIHSALQQLTIDHYVLIGHSLPVFTDWTM